MPKKDIKLRSVDTHFWDDNYVIDLDPIEKLLFLYLITNSLTNLAGIYEISLRRIAFDTGIDKDMILRIIDRFADDAKVFYKNGFIVMPNFPDHQKYNPSMEANVRKICSELPPELMEFVSKLENSDRLGSPCGQVEGKVEDKVEVEEKSNVPEFSDFFAYCKTLSIYHSSLDFQIEAKYNAWVENKWKDGNNKQIKNWKIKIQNTMPYFKRAYAAPEKGISRVVDDYKKTREMLDKLNTPINEIWKPEVK